MKMSRFAPFDAAEYLDSEEAIAAYLNVAAKDPDPDMLLAAIANVARAKGMSKLAQDSGLGRESLYKALRQGAKPRFETIHRILKGLNMRIELTPEQFAVENE